MSNAKKTKFLERCETLNEVLLLKDILVKDKNLYTELELEELVESMYEDTITLNSIKEFYKDKQEDYLLGASLTRTGLKDKVEVFKKNLKNILSVNKVVSKEEPCRPLFKGEVNFVFNSYDNMINNYPEKVYTINTNSDKTLLQWTLSEEIRNLFKSKVHLNHTYLLKEEWIERLIIADCSNKKYSPLRMRVYTDKRKFALFIDNRWYYN